MKFDRLKYSKEKIADRRGMAMGMEGQKFKALLLNHPRTSFGKFFLEIDFYNGYKELQMITKN